jgi:DNA-binding beta-propeller fold protein YncE
LPQGIAVDDKFIYVADTGNNRIQIFTKTGKFILAYGNKGSGPGEFNGPIGICVGKKGQIYVADTGNHRLQELKVSY